MGILKNFLIRLNLLGSAGAIALAILGLISYIPGLGVLGSVQEDYIPMAPSTAICFILLGGIILIFPYINFQRRYKIGACIISLIVLVFGFLELIGFYVGMDLNFEDSLVPSAGYLGEIPVARMSPSTGVVFFIAGLAVFGLIFTQYKNFKKRVIWHLPGILGSLTIIISFIFFLAYIYRTPLLYGEGPLIPMALTTALAFLMLGLAILAVSDKKAIPLKFFVQSNTHTQLLRGFFPLGIIAVLMGSFVTLIVPLYLKINAALISAIILALVASITGLIVNYVSKTIGQSIDDAKAKRKKAEKDLQNVFNRLELYKDLFTHDIRNILQGLQIGVDITSKYSSDIDKIEIVMEANTILNQQIKRGSNLVDNMSILSKLEEDKIDTYPVEVISLLNKMIQFLKMVYDDKNIEIYLHSEFEKILINGNTFMDKIFENILINAIVHNTNNTIVIDILINKIHHNNKNYIKMEFNDNGMGIEDSRKKKIFERDPTRKNLYGIGLGLSVVKKIVQSYNGTLLVEDNFKGEKKEGTKFILYFLETN